MILHPTMYLLSSRNSHPFNCDFEFSIAFDSRRVISLASAFVATVA